MKRARVLIVDDHPILREGISRLLERQADLEVCGEADDERAAMKAAATTGADIVLVDISLKSGDGLALTKELRRLYPQLPILILSMRDELLYAERAIRAGANGYIMKEEARENVVQAIRKVLGGGVYLSEAAQRHIMTHMRGDASQEGGWDLVARLTDRELETFRLIGQGHTTDRIAASLGVSHKTVEAHRVKIKEKLGIRNVTELIRLAVSWVENN